MLDKVELKEDKIVYVAAHSGGHIIPALSLAKKEKLAKSLITSSQLLDKKIVAKNCPELNCCYLNLPHTPPLKHSLGWLIKFFYSFFKSIIFFLKTGKCKVVSTGGVLSLPVCLAAKTLNKTIELYEFNVTPGKTTKILEKIADKVFIIYDKTREHLTNKNIEKIDYPIKWGDYTDPSEIEKHDFANKYGANKKVIIIVGGSQGARSLNKLILDYLDKFYPKDITIIHQTGPHIKECTEFYKQHNINAHTFEFIDDLEPFYKMADIIISRAGAGAIAEGLWSKAQLVLVPLQGVANNHQVENALATQNEYPKKVFIANDMDDIKNILVDKVQDV